MEQKYSRSANALSVTLLVVILLALLALSLWGLNSIGVIKITSFDPKNGLKISGEVKGDINKEKQTDKFVSIPCEKVSFSYIPGTVHYSPIYISFPITVHYLNENISYLIKSDFSSAYTYDYINYDSQISFDRTIYKYNKKEYRKNSRSKS